MNKLAKIGLATLGLVLLFKGAKASSAIMVAQGMAIRIIPEIKVIEGGLQITANLNISNPTDSSMVLTSPFVQLLHRGNLLSKNMASGNQIEIQPFSENNIPIKLKLTWEQMNNLLDKVNIKYPASYSNLQRLTWLYDNYKEVLNALGLNIQYSTYANGFKYQDRLRLNL